jgi:hypothetical protein
LSVETVLHTLQVLQPRKRKPEFELPYILLESGQVVTCGYVDATEKGDDYDAELIEVSVNFGTVDFEIPINAFPGSTVEDMERHGRNHLIDADAAYDDVGEEADRRHDEQVQDRLDGYEPGHYKSWNGDIPDVVTP